MGLRNDSVRTSLGLVVYIQYRERGGGKGNLFAIKQISMLENLYKSIRRAGSIHRKLFSIAFGFLHQKKKKEKKISLSFSQTFQFICRVVDIGYLVMVVASD